MFYCFFTVISFRNVWRGNDEWRIDKDKEGDGYDLF